MKKKLLQDTQILLTASTLKGLQWENIVGTSCITTKYNKQGYIICRYNFESGKQVISFNYLDENNSVPNDDFNNWEEDSAEFSILNHLYDVALQNTVAHA